MNRTALILALVCVFGVGCAGRGRETLREIAAPDVAFRPVGADKPPVAPLPDAPTLQDVVRRAEEASLELEAAFARWRAAVARVPQLDALPDPRLSLGYFLERVETRTGPQRWKAAVTQTFPWFGTLQARGDAAAEQANAAYARFEAERLRLVYRIKKAWAEYYLLGRSIAFVTENAKLVEQLEQTLRARYRTSDASHADLVRAQIEIGTVDDRLKELAGLRTPLRARLNALMDRPPGAEIPWPADVPDAAVDVDAATLDDASPELVALAHAIAAREIDVDLARKQGYPDLTVGLEYVDTGAAGMDTSGSGDDPVVAMVSLNVPIWRAKYRAAEIEAMERHRAARLERRDRANTLQADLAMALYAFRDAERRVSLYLHTLQPKARQAFTASQTAFRAGTDSFNDLLDAERVLLEFELAHERARVDRAVALAEIEMILGGELPPSPFSP